MSDEYFWHGITLAVAIAAAILGVVYLSREQSDCEKLGGVVIVDKYYGTHCVHEVNP